jgi:predicted nucleic acid-binding protein
VKVILDTNILMSAIFWGGKPRKILDLWLTGAFVLVGSKEIVGEYDAISHRLNTKYKTSDEVLFKTIISHLQLYNTPT